MKNVPIASWNSTRDRWEVGQMDLLSGLSDVYSETFPRSGMTRSGRLYELPPLEHVITETESFCLPSDAEYLWTPCAAELDGGPVNPDKARANGQTVRLNSQVLHLAGEL